MRETSMEERARYGPYTPRERLGYGGQAVVWRADGPSGPVALKIASRGALTLEAQLLEIAAHDQLVRVVDKAKDGSWLALQLVEGRNFADWAESRTPAEVLKVAADLFGVLAHLHDQGVVHGDWKPANVMVTADGTVKVLDLGIAAVGHEERRGFKGTLGYAAPEILSGERPSEAADIYGLGATVYHALAGRPPFVAPDPAALAYLPLVSLPLPPSAWRSQVPAPADQLVLQCLARDPRRRPADAMGVRDMLGSLDVERKSPPVVGQAALREALLQAVVGACDGEPRCVVVYGPPGSGRRTAIAEAIAAARREGMPYLKGGNLVAQVQKAGRPCALALNAAKPGSVEVTDTLIRAGAPVLALLRSERPVAGLEGALQLSPVPLTQRDVYQLGRFFGREIEDPEEWWRACQGHPAAVLARLYEGKVPGNLPEASRRILDAVGTGTVPVDTLARRLKMGQHELLDHCEVLVAGGWLVPSEDGAELRGSRPVPAVP